MKQLIFKTGCQKRAADINPFWRHLGKLSSWKISRETLSLGFLKALSEVDGSASNAGAT